MNINQPVQGRAFALPFTRVANPHVELRDDELRLPFIRRVSDNVRNHFVAMCGEYVGTVLFLFFALSGTQVANNIPSTGGRTVAEAGANPQQLQYIALCFGFSLAVNAWVFFRISGGLFNPAVTFGMCLIGALPWIRGVLLFVVQILGGITAAALVACMFPHPGDLNVRTSLGGGTTVVQGLFIEMFLTAQLIFTIFMLAAEKHKGTFIAPVGIGLSLFIAELTGVYFTGGSLNPARTFGPCVVNHVFNSYHWIYWLGPILGAIVAAGFYKFIKILEYETANPGQDNDHAAKVEKRKNLLLAAGINEVDAAKVAHELTEKDVIVETGRPNGTAPINGQEMRGQQNDPQGMYGTQFRQNSTRSIPNTSNAAYSAQQRPQATTTGSQIGRFSYLGDRGTAPGNNAQSQALSGEPRLQSPAMSTNEQLYAPLAAGADVPLGGSVLEHEPRQRMNRTASSYA